MPPATVLHSSPCLHGPQEGYVLFDALMALLLLTGTLLGAGLALVQSMAGSHAAALQTSAVGLAADLTESLYGAVLRDRVIEDWISQVARQLPAGTATAGIAGETDADSVPTLDIAIRWRDQGGQPFQLLLPVALPAPAEAP